MDPGNNKIDILPATENDKTSDDIAMQVRPTNKEKEEGAWGWDLSTLFLIRWVRPCQEMGKSHKEIR